MAKANEGYVLRVELNTSEDGLRHLAPSVPLGIASDRNDLARIEDAHSAAILKAFAQYGIATTGIFDGKPLSFMYGAKGSELEAPAILAVEVAIPRRPFDVDSMKRLVAGVVTAQLKHGNALTKA